MLRLLLKKQFTEIFRSYFYNPKKNVARSRGATVAMLLLFAVLMVGIVGGMFTLFAFYVCGTLVEVGLGWLYFTIFSLIAVLLGTFGSVFNTYSGLYLSKDNDLLLSMPIPVRHIITSRLLGVYLLGLMYSGIVVLPAIIVYWIVAPLTVASVIGSILLLLLISLFVLVLSCLLGWVVAKISLKLKNKSFITVLISLVCFGAYYFFYFKAQTLIQELVQNAVLYGAVIKSSAYPLYLLGRVAEGDWFAMAVIGAVVVAVFVLTWLLLSRSFLKIATASGNVSRTAYREGKAQLRSPARALLRKEFRRLTSSANYMLNCALGALLLVLVAGALLFKGNTLLTALSIVFAAHPDTLAVLVCAAICMVGTMNDTAAPSISLEGKSLWLLQSLPVEPWQVLRAKLTVQLSLTVLPSLLCSICAVTAFPFTAAEVVMILLVPQVVALLSACFGLFIGLKKPNLTWTSEIVPIKQSFGVMLALFGGWGYALLFGGGYLLIGWQLGAVWYLGGFAVLSLVAAVLLLSWLKRRGTKLLTAL